jgi:hypothetical protein
MREATMHNHEILKALTEAAARLVEAGHSEDDVFDNMLTLTVTWAVHKEGASEIGRRLYLLRLRCAADAEMREGAQVKTVN